MFTFKSVEGWTVVLSAAHIESLVTVPSSPNLTILTTTSGAKFSIATDAEAIAARIAQVISDARL